jgi:hypothetical protein
MLDVVFPFLLGRTPCPLRSFNVVRMNCVEPGMTKALVQPQPCKVDPLRASPGPSAIRLREEYELRNAGSKKSETLFTLSQTLIRDMLFGKVARNL